MTKAGGMVYVRTERKRMLAAQAELADYIRQQVVNESLDEDDALEIMKDQLLANGCSIEEVEREVDNLTSRGLKGLSTDPSRGSAADPSGDQSRTTTDPSKGEPSGVQLKLAVDPSKDPTAHPSGDQSRLSFVSTCDSKTLSYVIYRDAKGGRRMVRSTACSGRNTGL